jgi:hypothetical protein
MIIQRKEKCMNRLKAGNMVEYVIPTAIVGIALGLGLFYMVSSGTFSKHFEGTISGKKTGDTLILNSFGSSKSQIQPGSLGGTPSSPSVQCTSGSCVIDFGDYVLKGIPETLSDVTTASRGGEATAVYANILTQMAYELMDTQPDQANLLLQMAEEARKMANVEIALDNKVKDINDREEQIALQSGDAWTKAGIPLSTIDPANLKPGDCAKILASASYLNREGLITQEQLDGITLATLSIKRNPAHLNPGQQNFLNQIVASPSHFISFYGDAVAHLGTSETALILKEESAYYNITTHRIDVSINAVDSTSTFGPGQEFNNLYTQFQASSALYPPEMAAMIEYSATQIQTIGNSIESVETPLTPTIVKLDLEIPADAGIETQIASELLTASGG